MLTGTDGHRRSGPTDERLRRPPPTGATGTRRPSSSPPARLPSPPCRPARRQVPPGSVTTTAPRTTATPAQLPDGGVLVVGASASGVQIAEELHRSGRPVTLAVGEHVRMPRTYRGRDILWWMDASGVLDERHDEVPDLVRARNLPSMQLIGSPGRTLDLNALGRLGVRLVGRFVGVRDGRRPVLGVAAERVRAGRPQAGPAARRLRRLGRAGRGATPSRRSGSPRPRCRPRRCPRRSAARGSPRSSGRPATGRTCPSSTSTCSTGGAGSCTTAASPPPPAST